MLRISVISLLFFYNTYWIKIILTVEFTLIVQETSYEWLLLCFTFSFWLVEKYIISVTSVLALGRVVQGPGP